MTGKNTIFAIGLVGFGILTFGTIGTWYLFPYIVDLEIHKNIDLKEGTQAYDIWKKQPFPLKFKIRFFNVSNPDEVQMGANPVVKELGPYVYDEYRERVKIETDEDKDVLRYVLKKTYFFNKEESGCNDQDDVVTILNAALVGTALQVEQLIPTALETIGEAIPFLYPGVKNVFLTAKVRDILFEGVRIYCQDPSVGFVCGAMKGALPKTIQVAENEKDFIFSMFGHLNGTDDGPWEMGRGLRNSTRGQIYSYEYDEQIEFWGEGGCRMINGSDSTVFPPFHGKEKHPRLYAFAQDFCRSLYITYEKEDTQFGINGYRYTSTEDSLARSPENKCFCPILVDEDGNDKLTCPPKGTADITPCFKAPVLISYPHFYLGDEKLLDYVTGLNPKKELHENYVFIEPKTATPLEGRKRVQINLHLKPFAEFYLMQNVSNGVFPVLWIEEGVKLPDDITEFLASNMAKLRLLDWLKWGLILTGLVIICSTFLLVMRKEKLLCFTNNSSVNITTTKSTVGVVNDAYETNSSLYPQLDNKNVSNRFKQRISNQIPPRSWDADAWRRGVA